MRAVRKYSRTKKRVKFTKALGNLSQKPWFQGVLLLSCVVVAMLLANLPATKHLYHQVLQTSLQLHISNLSEGFDLLFPRDMNVEKFINDILMVIFFFTVGLEIRREVACGELSTPKKALMPVIAAFGGVIAPAVIYACINHGTAASSGWGIPTATDIAFAVCIMSVLGDKVPVSLKVFLTALAIADDLIAILVVALFYGGSINFPVLILAFVVIALTLLMRRAGEMRMAPYLVAAVLVWALFYYGGIHATMSGVVMAFLIPATSSYNDALYMRKSKTFLFKLQELEFEADEQRAKYLAGLEQAARKNVAMTTRVEHKLAPWVNFLIMPVFALANAGVEITSLDYFNVFHFDPQLGANGMGIFLGLLLGKPIGITLFSLVAIKLHVGEMPSKATWPMFFAVACLGGIGFTMSIFVDSLSFGDQAPEITAHLRDAGKIAVLMGSVCAGVLGSILVNFVSKIRK